jgi:hypothetical protein
LAAGWLSAQVQGAGVVNQVVLDGTGGVDGKSFAIDQSVAKRGRVAGHTPEARARQAEKPRGHAAAVKAWTPSAQPGWLTEEFYRKKIQPRLSGITVPAISSALGLSIPYAVEIRAGKQLLHPRHWLRLAMLAGVSQE